MNFKDYCYQKLLNECTSVASSFDNKIVLAKNRDRTYAPTIKVVREIINGLEVVYLYDEHTDYSEGMNESGIGIVNTTLQGKKDENAGLDEKGKKRKRVNKDGFKIRKALGYSDPVKVVKSLDLFNRGLGGHTTVGCPDAFFSIEKIRFGKPVIKKHSLNSVIVRTNHGIAYPDQGYQFGKDRDSSLSRAFYANKEARESFTPDELLVNLRKHHSKIHGYQEPYRTNYKVWTSSQIMLNLTDLKFTLVLDENTRFMGVENRLPKDYEPKIKVNIQKVEISFNVTKSKDF